METLVSVERRAAVHGVPGRMTVRHVWPSAPHLFMHQTWFSESRPISGYGPGGKITVEMRYSDNPQNGHNTFAITASVVTAASRALRDVKACGCLHDDIAKVFPELAHLIRWHLVSSDGPMHYVANTVYQAGDRDCRGKRKGEPYAWATALTFGDNPIHHKISDSFAKFLQDAAPGFELEIVSIASDKPKTFQPKYTFAGYADKWYQCPFDDYLTALNFLTAIKTCSPKFTTIPTLFSDGKKRELDHARSSAVWPDATDSELMAEPEELKKKLADRLPVLLVEFRAAIEGIGFDWEPVK